MANRLRGKIALVAGAGSIGPGIGIGKVTSILFARERADVLAVDRDLEPAKRQLASSH